MSSQKNVPGARIELGTTLRRPALYHLIFAWQGFSFLKIFLVYKYMLFELQYIRLVCLLFLCKIAFSERSILFCLYLGLRSQSTIFQSCRDGATASWVLPVLS